MRRTNFGRHHRKISPHLLLPSLSEAFNEYPAYEYLSTRRVTIVNHRIENFSPVVNQARTPKESISRRLLTCNTYAPAYMFRSSANANGSAESRSARMFLYSRQRCSRRRALRAAALHRFLGLLLLRTANARHRRAHQSDASARIFCVLRRVFWSPQGHLVGDAASGRACILCAPARSKERGASPQNLRTSAPFVARHCFSPHSTFYQSLKYGNYRFRGTPQAYYS